MCELYTHSEESAVIVEEAALRSVDLFLVMELSELTVLKEQIQKVQMKRDSY